MFVGDRTTASTLLAGAAAVGSTEKQCPFLSVVDEEQMSISM